MQLIWTEFFGRADALLRGESPFRVGETVPRARIALPATIAVFGVLYGVAMGSFALDSPQRLWMVVYSGMKVPLLLMATALLCMPAFFALNTVAGLRDDFRDAVKAILLGQAGAAVALASLAPLTLVSYWSCITYENAILFNALMFALAAVAGQVLMLRHYRMLIRRSPRHRWLLATWLTLYAFVGIQMGWMLRPFVGSPELAVAFFRPEPFSNAYVQVARLLFGAK